MGWASLAWTVLVLGFYYRGVWQIIEDYTLSRIIDAGLRVTATFLPVLGLLAILVGGVVLGRRLRPHRLSRALLLGLTGAGLLVAGAAALIWLWRLSEGDGAAGLLPHLGTALWRSLLAVSALLLVLAAAQGLGLFTLRLLGWPTCGWRETFLYGAGTGFGLLAYLALGLAQVGLYTPSWVRLMVVGLAVAGCAWGLWFLTHRGPAWTGRISRTTCGPAALPRGSLDAVWAVIALAAILAAALAALAPEREYDALWYHLQLPRVWLQQGRLVPLPGEYISFYPGTWELIFGAGLVFGGGIGAKLLHFVCLRLTGLAVYQLTCRFLPSASPWLAVALFVTVPTVIWEASTAYVDLALSLHVILLMYALLRYLEQRSAAWLTLGGLQLGFALATKHLALLVCPIAAGGLILWLWLKDGRLRQAIGPALMLALLSVAVVAPWYVRSWLATGNPVFPELYAVFGAAATHWDAVTQAGLERFLERFGPDTWFRRLALPWDITVNAASYGGTLGPAFLLILPGLLLRRGVGSPATVWLLFFTGAYLALWASPLSSYQLRFLVAIAPALAILASEAAGRALARIAKIGAWARWAAYVVIGAVLVLNLPPFTRLHEWDGWLTHVMRSMPLAVVLGRVSEAAYLEREVASYAAWQFINDHLPADARILTFSGGDHFYSDRARLWSDSTLTRGAVWGAEAGEEQEALARLRELGVTHVLFDKRQLEAGELDNVAIAQPIFFDRWLAEVYEDDRFILYQLR